MPHDRLVLTLLWRDAQNAWRSLSRSDAAWIVGGGGLLLAYVVADVWYGLGLQAAKVRADQNLWLLRGPLTLAAIGAGLGYLVANLSARRALAPFLKALPIAFAARRRMAVVAGGAIAAPMVAAAGILTALAALIVARPNAAAWGLCEAAAFAAAYGSALLGRLAVALREDEVFAAAPRTPRGPRLFRVGALDGGRLPWIGGWAWGLSAGRVRLTFRRAVLTLAFAVLAALAAIGGLARHDAGPAAAVGLLGGLALFMLTARYAPLLSPVLRTSPVGFGRAWRRLTRLPLVASGGFFAVSAGAAMAAEPAKVAARVADGVGLMILDGSFAVFAAYFAASPLTAVAAFLAAILYALYEASEFGGAMVIGFGGLLALLWARAKRRYLHG
jgi:hypothetical protein